MHRINALTIAGTDPIGGSGIQADLKTFSALKAYGTSVITALVSQNTNGVQLISPIKTSIILTQLNSILSDVRIDSVKIGMLLNSSIVKCISKQLKTYNLPFLILDPVMHSKSGNILLSTNAISIMIKSLLPQVSLITPNLLETAVLLNCKVARNEDDIIIQGKKLLELGSQAVLIKGGHLNSTESPDWLFTHSKQERFTAPRIKTNNTHGTGCALSSALAVLRLHYYNWSDTLPIAKKWLQKTLLHADSLEVGNGKYGPVHHFHEWW